MITLQTIFRKSEGLEEIVFRNRNKEYGAYALRKELPAALNRSAVFIIGAAVMISLLLLHFSNRGVPVKLSLPTEITTTFEKIDRPDFKLPEPPPAAPSSEMMHSLIYDWSKPLIDENAMPEINPQGPDNIDYPNGTNDFPLVAPQTIPETDGNGIFGKSFIRVEEMPTFLGEGIDKFAEWVKKQVVYPQDAAEAGIEGTVTAGFVIGTDGSVQNIVIMKSVHPDLDQEVIRVLSRSPLWKPGKQGGTPVRVIFFIPVKFALQH